MALTTLPWKRIRMLFGKPPLINEHRTTIKSVRLVGPASTELTHFIWVPSAYCYVPEYTAYAVSFWAIISIEIIRSSRFRENQLCVWGTPGGPQVFGTRILLFTHLENV